MLYLLDMEFSLVKLDLLVCHYIENNRKELERMMNAQPWSRSDLLITCKSQNLAKKLVRNDFNRINIELNCNWLVISELIPTSTFRCYSIETFCFVLYFIIFFLTLKVSVLFNPPVTFYTVFSKDLMCWVMLPPQMFQYMLIYSNLHSS